MNIYYAVMFAAIIGAAVGAVAVAGLKAQAKA